MYQIGPKAVLLLVGSTSGQSICPGSGDNVAPCLCNRPDSQGDVITCSGVAMSTVQSVFNSMSSSSVFSVVLTPLASESTIPSNVLSNKLVSGTITLVCPNSASYKLSVNTNAFNPTKTITTGVGLRGCDLNGFNFGFLSGFTAINSLYFDSDLNIHLSGIANLPSLPTLSLLSFGYSSGLNSLTTFPALKGVKQLIFDHSTLSDQGIANFLNWGANNFASTLSSVWIYSSQITQMPTKLNPSTFPSLSSISFDSNSISSLSSGSLTFTQPIQRLDITNCGLQTMAQGTFVGKCNDVLLGNN